MFNNILLNSGLNAVAFNTVAIFGIILSLAFIFSLLVDLIFLIFAPKRNGLFFKRPKDKNNQQAPQQIVERIVYRDSEKPKQESTVTPYENIPTVIPYSELDETEELFAYDFSDEKSEEPTEVNFDKAMQEQKMLERKFRQEDDDKQKDEVNVYTHDDRSAENTFESIFNIIEEDVDKEKEDIDAIIAEVQAQAMSEISDEGKEIKPVAEVVEEEEIEEIEEEVKEKKVAKRKLPKAKIIFKTVQAEAPKQEEKEDVAEVEDKDLRGDNLEASELRKIRENLFNLRVQAFNELRSTTLSKDDETTEEIEQDEPEVLDEESQEKIDQLEAERQALIKTNINVLGKNENLEKTVEALVAKIENLQSQPAEEQAGHPAQSKEYYENRLKEIEDEFKDVQKDLRKNKREFNPLKRIKRTFDRDVVKLRRKEATVAKQKLRIYGVNNTANIDEEKVKELEVEVEVLKKLKDSVHQCEIVLEENKDRYPVLENSIKILTRHADSLNKEKEAILKELEWFESN